MEVSVQGPTVRVPISPRGRGRPAGRGGPGGAGGGGGGGAFPNSAWCGTGGRQRAGANRGAAHPPPPPPRDYRTVGSACACAPPTHAPPTHAALTHARPCIRLLHTQSYWVPTHSLTPDAHPCNEIPSPITHMHT